MLLESPVLTSDTDVSDVPASVVLPDSSEPEGVPASTFTNALIAAAYLDYITLSAIVEISDFYP